MVVKSILITGGCAFVGCHIVQQLLERSTSDNQSVQVSVASRHPKNKDSRVTYHSANITDRADMTALLDKVKQQAVIHTFSPDPLDIAALHGTNVDGTRILLDWATACPATRAFVYTSSDYACQPTRDVVTEDQVNLYNAQHYNNPYSKTKAIADAMVLTENGPDLRTSVLRIPAIYGEDDSDMIPQLLESICKGEHKMQIGDNAPFFEFCYVDSAAQAHVLAVEELVRADQIEGPSDPALKMDGEAFFISDW